VFLKTCWRLGVVGGLAICGFGCDILSPTISPQVSISAELESSPFGTLVLGRFQNSSEGRIIIIGPSACDTGLILSVANATAVDTVWQERPKTVGCVRATENIPLSSGATSAPRVGGVIEEAELEGVPDGTYTVTLIWPILVLDIEGNTHDLVVSAEVGGFRLESEPEN